jgi:glycosyltransferase involved in cell wall biosynthesis
MPKISAGMPVLNGEATIARAIEDLLAQTFTDFEVVVCDNASDDRTAEIAETYARKDPRVRVARFRERVDIMYSFKRAFDNTTAPFFFFTPADDRWYPSFMERTLAVLEAEPSLTACSGRVAFTTGLRFSHISTGTDPLLGTPKQNVAKYLRDPVENARAFSLVRREAMVGAFPAGEYPGWDFQMTARTLAHGGYQELPEVLSERVATPLHTYIEHAQRHFGSRLLRGIPLHKIAFEVLKDRQIPKSWGLLPALVALAARSHWNYAADRMPRWYAILSRIADALRIADDIPEFWPPSDSRL